jgi:hypothetical protein
LKKKANSAKNTNILDTNEEDSLHVNAEKTKFVYMSVLQNAEQICNRSVSMLNKLFENVAQFKHFGTRVT